MFRPGNTHANERRRGIILLVVLAMLTLFAVVGLSFVLYADAEANASKTARDAEAQASPQIDPVALFNFGIGAILYDARDDDSEFLPGGARNADFVPGVYSAVRGHSLARTMYGLNTQLVAEAVTVPPVNNPNASFVAFNGTGRLHNATSPLSNYNDASLVNYTYFRDDTQIAPAARFIRDPERLGFDPSNNALGYRAVPGTGLPNVGGDALAVPRGLYTAGANPPYTYPDHNNMFLAAVQAIDPNDPRRPGPVLVQSFYRPWLFGPLDRSNPNWTNPEGKYLMLRPRPIDMGPDFPYPEDGGGDVKNLTDSPGVRDPSSPNTSPRYFNNDSIWMDFGFPVVILPDGRKIKPLFAPLIMDLDNRININTAGNIRGLPNGGPGNAHRSNQGWGPWEVGLAQVIPNRAPNFDATNVLAYRYGPDGMPNSPPGPGVPMPNWYAQGDFDGSNEQSTPPYAVTGRYQLPQYAVATDPFTCFPSFLSPPPAPMPIGYGNGSPQEMAAPVPWLYNPLTPSGDDRFFPMSLLDEFRWYTDRRSNAPAYAPGGLSSSFPDLSNSYARRLVTTHSMQLDRPAASPWLPYTGTYVMPGGAYQYPIPSVPITAASETGTVVTITLGTANPGFVAGQQVTIAGITTNPAVNPGYNGTFTITSVTPPGGMNTNWTFTYNGPAGLTVPPLTSVTVAGAAASPANAYPLLSGRNAGPNAWVIPTGSEFLTAPRPNPFGFPAAPRPGGDPNSALNSKFVDWRADIALALRKVDLNRPLADYPPVNPAGYAAGDLPQFYQAQQDRQNLAMDIYNALRLATGSTASVDTDAQRWLAQLAVNIVDYIDNDDFSTPFNYDGPSGGTSWVFGTELPRVVLNEVYALGGDNGNGVGGPVRVWVELHNTFNTSAGNWPTEGGLARLQVGAGPGSYAAYQVVLARRTPASGPVLNFLNKSTGTDNRTSTGDVSGGGFPTSILSNWPAGRTPDAQVILPSNGAYRAPGTNGNASNQGFYLVGPGPLDTDMGVVAANVPKVVFDSTPALQFGIPVDGSAWAPTLLLQRLACPYRQPSNTPGPDYNPYITVDVFDLDTSADTPASGWGGDYFVNKKGGSSESHFSVGRTQPYAAQLLNQTASSQVWPYDVNAAAAPPYDRRPFTPGSAPPAYPKMPQTTFYRHNACEETPVAAGTWQMSPNQVMKNPPFDWLVHLDRQLISPVELLHVSGFRPHQLTQRFYQAPAAGGPAYAFNHYAPWFNTAAASQSPPGNPYPNAESSRLWRAFEYLQTSSRVSGMARGGRLPGLVNIGTVWDERILQALADAQPAGNPTANSFTSADVTTIFNTLKTLRSPAVASLFPAYPGVWPSPVGPSDKTASNGADTSRYAQQSPFVSQSGGFRPGDETMGSGSENTMLRSASGTGGNRLFELTTPTHPYQRMELLTKIFNNVTTKSNVFAVYLTVGFFEVTDDTTRPVKLGAEVGRAQNRQVRHRMFAIIDRSNLSVATSVANVVSAGAAGSNGPLLISGGNPVNIPAQPTSPPTINTALGTSSDLTVVASLTPPAAAAATYYAGAGDIKIASPVVPPPGVAGAPPSNPSLVGWVVRPGSTIVINPGQPTEETVTVLTVNNTSPPSTNVLITTSPLSFAHGGVAGVTERITVADNPGPVPVFFNNVMAPNNVADPRYATNLPLSGVPPAPALGTPPPAFVAGSPYTVAVSSGTSNGSPTLSGVYDGIFWNIATGSQLVIDEGPDQEIVTVTGVDTTNNTFTAKFSKLHKPGFVVSNTLLGNPGPQAALVPGNRLYSQDALTNSAFGYSFVVRYLRVIE
jgi:hypothetical protein